MLGIKVLVQTTCDLTQPKKKNDGISESDLKWFFWRSLQEAVDVPKHRSFKKAWLCVCVSLNLNCAEFRSFSDFSASFRSKHGISWLDKLEVTQRRTDKYQAESWYTTANVSGPCLETLPLGSQKWYCYCWLHCLIRSIIPYVVATPLKNIGVIWDDHQIMFLVLLSKYCCFTTYTCTI